MYNTEMDEALKVIDKGLKKTISPKQIIVVGAGMAGLVSASLLKAAGHDVKIFEANNRVGGRIETVRMEDTGFKNQTHNKPFLTIHLIFGNQNLCYS